MNRNLVRLFIGALVAIPVAGGLFFIMQYLIASANPEIDDSKQRKLADIHMPEREIETNVTEAKPDKPDEPDEPPPQSMKRCRFIDCGETGRVRLAAAARGRDQVHAAARPVRGRLPAVAHRDVVPSALRADAGGRRRSRCRC